MITHYASPHGSTCVKHFLLRRALRDRCKIFAGQTPFHYNNAILDYGALIIITGYYAIRFRWAFHISAPRAQDIILK